MHGLASGAHGVSAAGVFGNDVHAYAEKGSDSVGADNALNSSVQQPTDAAGNASGKRENA